MDPVLKTGEQQCSVGSNPTPSAIQPPCHRSDPHEYAILWITGATPRPQIVARRDSGATETIVDGGPAATAAVRMMDLAVPIDPVRGHEQTEHFRRQVPPGGLPHRHHRPLLPPVIPGHRHAELLDQELDPELHLHLPDHSEPFRFARI